VRVAVFGASGRIGRLVVKHALEEGYAVNACVRDPAKLPIEDESLSVITGGLRDTAAIEQTISGCDAVICALGVPLKFTYDSMDSLEGHRNIIKAMDKLGVSRLIDWATPSARFSGDKRSVITVVPGILAGLAFPKAKKEIVSICDAIRESDLQWTIVRFMAPKDRPPTGAVKVGLGDTKMKFSISREDIASFMVEQVESETYLYSMPIIGS
jgi:Putative NADH-flavin reductase